MAKWLDKLKHLIKIDITINAPLIHITRNKIKNSGNTQIRVPESGTQQKTYYLNLDDYTKPEDLQIIKKGLKEYIASGNRLLETNTSNLLEEYSFYKKNKSNQTILNFFEPIIPTNDLEALEAALFLRDKFHRGENIMSLKDGIRKRFGDRGSNISNLCTAGYFENILMQLYNETETPVFNKIYEDIVTNSMVAVFVNHSTKAKDIPSEISRKLTLCKKYGLKFIDIHGISNHNIQKIKQCIKEQKKFFDFFEKKVYENSENHIIIIRLLIK